MLVQDLRHAILFLFARWIFIHLYPFISFIHVLLFIINTTVNIIQWNKRILCKIIFMSNLSIAFNPKLSIEISFD